MKMQVEEEKRFALLLAANDSDYVKKVYGGYFNVFVNAFGEEGEKWDLYRVVNGEFPSAVELDNYHGFVISGSPHDAYGDDFWILRLCFLIQILYVMRKKVLGICFGHQVLCRALGGRVEKACGGWDLGLRKVKMCHEHLAAGNFVDENLEKVPAYLSIIECHQDEVTEVPRGAQVLAKSDKTGVEMFKLGNKIMGIQGHPEYTKDIVYNIIDRLLQSSFINKEFAEEAKACLEDGEADREIWEKLCKSFLKSDLS